MSRENVELVGAAIEAFNRRDLRVLAEFSHRDLEFVSFLTGVDAGGATYRGSEAWTSYFEAMDETWQEWQVGDFRLFDGGDDRVASVARVVGKGKHSGVPVERALGFTYRIRDGKVWRMRSYPDPSDALEAVGLRE